MRSVLQCHWGPALLLLLLVCYSTSDALEVTNSSSPTKTSTVSTHPIASITPSITISPTTTSTTSPPTTPTPPPNPHRPLLLYEGRVLLYLRIDEFSIKFTGAGGGNFPNVNRSVLEGLGELKYEIHNSANEVVFTKWYGSATQNFSMKFDFTTNTSDDGPKWYIRSITHSNPNVSSDRNVLFVYQSIQYNVKAPLGYVYSCDKVRAVGYDSADPGVLPTLELRNITVQAFFNGKISENIFTCGDKNETNSMQIGLIIGLVLGITVILAVIVIAISTFVMKWKKKTDYDLLD